MPTDVSSIKSALWEAANILRGSAVDRTDWKGYILPLLFFKRICDVWDEETADAADTYGDADPSQFPEVHRFQVPEGCHWDDVRATAKSVGASLKHAMQEIERANPDTLYRVFGTGDWGNKETFTDELDMVGWLCPALLKYFGEPPKQIYAEVRPRADVS